MSARERPILMSAPMVRAILAGTKTQTRRAVLPQPDEVAMANAETNPQLCFRVGDAIIPARCRYGAPGDRLWVRETWCHQYPHEGAPDRKYVYRADGEEVYGLDPQGHAIVDGKGRFKTWWVPSIHMPRAASRITLEVTEVRVERLCDISWQDCRGEGVAEPDGIGDYDTWQDAYFALWDSINGAGAAARNPWVWVVSFRRLP